MHDYMQKQALQAAVKPRFHGHDILKCRTEPRFPESAEREYMRMTDSLMRLVNEAVKKHLPEAVGQLRLDADGEDERIDTAAMLAALDAAFLAMERELAERLTKFGLRQKLERFAQLNRKLTVREWKRAIKATLGIDILEDYYSGAFFEKAMTAWIEHNTGLIVTIPQSTLGEMKGIVREGFLTGKRTKEITREIQDAYHRTKRHARLLARDQTAKLNGQLTEAQQRDAGVNEYVWSTCGDSRVRDSHRRLHGKRFSWDNPPEVTPGRRLHPGQDYQCRCVALPVFNLEGIELPWEKGLDDFVTKGYRHVDIPNTGIGLYQLAKETGVSTAGTDAQIKNRILSQMKKQGWKHV